MATSGTGGAKLPPKKNPQWPPAAENGVVHRRFRGWCVDEFESWIFTWAVNWWGELDF
jgi:hypothetical protein